MDMDAALRELEQEQEAEEQGGPSSARSGDPLHARLHGSGRVVPSTRSGSATAAAASAQACAAKAAAPDAHFDPLDAAAPAPEPAPAAESTVHAGAAAPGSDDAGDTNGLGAGGNPPAGDEPLLQASASVGLEEDALQQGLGRLSAKDAVPPAPASDGDAADGGAHNGGAAGALFGGLETEEAEHSADGGGGEEAQAARPDDGAHVSGAQHKLPGRSAAGDAAGAAGASLQASTDLPISLPVRHPLVTSVHALHAINMPHCYLALKTTQKCQPS
jgi:hypothetical protein